MYFPQLQNPESSASNNFHIANTYQHPLLPSVTHNYTSPFAKLNLSTLSLFDFHAQISCSIDFTSIISIAWSCFGWAWICSYIYGVSPCGIGAAVLAPGQTKWVATSHKSHFNAHAGGSLWEWSVCFVSLLKPHERCFRLWTATSVSIKHVKWHKRPEWKSSWSRTAYAATNRDSCMYWKAA